MSDIYENVHKGLNEPLMTLFEVLKKQRTDIHSGTRWHKKLYGAGKISNEGKGKIFHHAKRYVNSRSKKFSSRFQSKFPK